MSSYDDNLYTYLTKPENFDTYIDMVKQFESIRNRLLIEFWRDVELELKNTNKSSWKVWLDDNAPHNTSKLGFYHEDYTDEVLDVSSCLIIFERLGAEVMYGLWFFRESRVQQIDFPTICEYVKQFHKNWKAGSGGWWFAAYQLTGDDFRKPDHLKRIVPGEHRKAVVKEYANYLINALNDLAVTGMKYGKKFKQ